MGFSALSSIPTGSNNTAEGQSALANLTTGSGNTALGSNALSETISGSSNTAVGYFALVNNTADANTATGYQALYSNTTGSFYTANGESALLNNTTGSSNTADGNNTLSSNTTGSSNIALGVSAGSALTTGSNNIDIGNAGVAAEASTIRIGSGTQTNAYIAGIYQATVAKGVSVVIDSAGHLGTKGSSERLKDAIQPMDKASEAILSLQPVTFRYKRELDPAGIPQLGLVAEQVEKVDPELVVRDEQGKSYSVRYEAVNAMLLNGFLKAHRTIEEQGRKLAAQDAKTQQQKTTITQLLQQVKTLSGRLDEQAAPIQKVSAQMSMTRPASGLVDNQ